MAAGKRICVRLTPLQAKRLEELRGIGEGRKSVSYVVQKAINSAYFAKAEEEIGNSLGKIADDEQKH